jgi:two-component system, cell cycle response regulator
MAMPLRGPRRTWLYAVAGVGLSLAAPTGLLILRELYAPRPVATELLSDRLTYIYVLIGTAVVLACVGFLLGRQADRLAALSHTDALTGLPNRRALGEHIRDELLRSIRYRVPTSLLLLDVDGLKQVNDKLGHAAGDQVIRSVAAAIRQTLRATDFGARWGGDEFAIVAPNTTSEAARHSAERLIQRLADQHSEGGHPATVSVGIATFDPARATSTDPESLVSAADEALYVAKANGKNRVQAA